MRSRRTSRRAVLTSTAALLTAAATGPPANGAPAACGPDERRSGREATVDRIVDDAHVVLLLEEDGRVVNELVVPREDLPTAEAGDRLAITTTGGDLESACPLDGETGRRRGRLAAWFRSLATRLG